MGVPLRPGDVIDGAYVVERLLGQGGMGAVFVAFESRLARRVAIKVLLGGGTDNPEALARFEREARSAAALQSDHVARVFSVGVIADMTPYIVMELLDGEDLSGVLKRRGPLPAAEVVALMLQVCDALIEAHTLGIVHRDLKPANIFLARRPTGATTIKVLDFGISTGATGAPTAPLTATKAVMGTPLYLSPEQVRDVRSVDGRTDIWALGVVMYELLTGRPPFLADSLPDVLHRILDVAVLPLSHRRSDVPPALEATVLRCLAKERSDRFTTVRDLSAALAASLLPAAPHAPSAPRTSTARMPLASPSGVSPHAASIEVHRPAPDPLALAQTVALDPPIAPTIAMTDPSKPTAPPTDRATAGAPARMADPLDMRAPLAATADPVVAPMSPAGGHTRPSALLSWAGVVVIAVVAVAAAALARSSGSRAAAADSMTTSAAAHQASALPASALPASALPGSAVAASAVSSSPTLATNPKGPGPIASFRPLGAPPAPAFVPHAPPATPSIPATLGIPSAPTTARGLPPSLMPATRY